VPSLFLGLVFLSDFCTSFYKDFFIRLRISFLYKKIGENSLSRGHYFVAEEVGCYSNQEVEIRSFKKEIHSQTGVLKSRKKLESIVFWIVGMDMEEEGNVSNKKQKIMRQEKEEEMIVKIDDEYTRFENKLKENTIGFTRIFYDVKKNDKDWFCAQVLIRFGDHQWEDFQLWESNNQVKALFDNNSIWLFARKRSAKTNQVSRWAIMLVEGFENAQRVLKWNKKIQIKDVLLQIVKYVEKPKPKQKK
jgi:hypothetical protein